MVRRGLVDDDRLTGKFCSNLRIDITVLLAEKARIQVKTSYLSGKVEALCIPEAIFHLVLVWHVRQRGQILPPLRLCQKTVSKGTVKKTSMENTPVVDVPFKRVAVDLIGSIETASEAGHRYILTLVDYATRYPEAVPLKRIDTETVAEARVDIYSCRGVPYEILCYQGTQFISDCMKEECRLPGVTQSTTTPYHPMCNGLVEKFNGTLKKMLKRHQRSTLCVQGSA